MLYIFSHLLIVDQNFENQEVVMYFQKPFYTTSVVILCNFAMSNSMDRACLVNEKITPEVVRAAQRGDAYSQYLMGQFHENGLPIYGFADNTPVRNRMEVISWYKQAALQGNAMSQYRLGKLFLRENKIADALNFFTKAAAQDHALSLYELALLYQQNQEESAQEKAFIFFKKVVENSAILQHASLEKNYEEMVKKAQSRAAYHIGKVYEKGLSSLVMASCNSAADYYKLSIAKDEYERAFYALAVLLDNQQIVSTMNDEAKIYLLQAQAKKLPEASSLLAKILIKEEGKITNEALKLYEEAADGEDEEALLKLGSYYETGTCCQQSMEKAFEYYKKAAARGNAKLIDLFKSKADKDADSCCFLAHLYLLGKKIPKNESQAIAWAREGVKKGSEQARVILKNIGQTNCEALYILGYMYEMGEGGEKNLDLAINFYEKAARAMNPKALQRLEELARNKNQKASFIVGKFLQEGLPGVQKDISAAVALYKKAVEQGSGQAAFVLGNLFLEGKEVPESEEWSLYYFEQALTKNCKQAFEAIKDMAKRSPAAACVVGTLYEQGAYVEKNSSEAENWYRQASRQKYAPAFYALGRLAEQKRPLLINSPQSAVDCYLDALYWYKNNESAKKLARFDIRRLDTVLLSLHDLGQPDFAHEFFAKIKPTLPCETSPYLLYHVAYLSNVIARSCSENVQKILLQALIDLTKQENVLTYSVLSHIAELMQAAAETGSVDKEKIFNLCRAIQLMQPINAHKSSNVGPALDTHYTGDPLVAIYNCLFKNSQSLMKSDEALANILDLFDEQVEAKLLNAQSLQAYAIDLSNESYAHLKESLTKFLLVQKKYLAPVALTLLGLKPDLRTHHIAYLVKLSLEAQKQGSDLHLRYLTHPLFLDSQNIPLALRVAIVLAQLREKILISFIKSDAKNGKLSNILIYQKVGRFLELIGDPAQTTVNLADWGEIEDENENAYLSTLDYFNQNYSLNAMIDHIKQEIDTPKQSGIPKDLLNAFMMQALNLDDPTSLYDETGLITKKSVEQLLTLLNYFAPIT